jgi:hypothetical protein
VALLLRSLRLEDCSSRLAWTEKFTPSQVQWCAPVILTTQEAKTGKFTDPVQPTQKVCKTPSQTTHGGTHLSF